MIRYYCQRLIQKLTGKERSLKVNSHLTALIQLPPGSLKKALYTPEQLEDLNFFLKRIKPGNSYMDVGANYGFFPLAIQNKLKGNVVIHCFEPTDNAFRVLTQNNYLNGGSWNCHKLAVGEEQKWIEIENNLGGFNHVSTQKSATTKPALCIPLDNYIEDNNISCIDFLKIDVEGFEWFVLQGAKRSFEKNIFKNILLENQGHQKRFGVEHESYAVFFEKFGYIKSEEIPGHECWTLA